MSVAERPGVGAPLAALGALVVGLLAASCASGPSMHGAGSSGGKRSTPPSRPPAGTSTAASRAGASDRPPPTSSAASTTAPVRTTPPAFVGQVAATSAAQLGATYRPGCPVGPAELRTLTMSYWGFDGRPHLGTMVVNTAVASEVLTVFGALYAERFPIRMMEPESDFDGHDPLSMAADNTSGFNCRYAVAPGPPQWSVHAYGEAIDVNPVENPYLEGGEVQPAAGAAYLERADVRPGMAVPGGQLVEAFAAVGWQWGGRWTEDPDYQHFSATGG